MTNARCPILDTHFPSVYSFPALFENVLRIPEPVGFGYRDGMSSSFYGAANERFLQRVVRGKPETIVEKVKARKQG